MPSQRLENEPLLTVKLHDADATKTGVSCESEQTLQSQESSCGGRTGVAEDNVGFPTYDACEDNDGIVDIEAPKSKETQIEAPVLNEKAGAEEAKKKDPNEYFPRFLFLCTEIHKMIVNIPSYKNFLLTIYLPLTFIKLLGSLSTVVAVIILEDGFNNGFALNLNKMSFWSRPAFLITGIICGLLNLGGRLVPPMMSIALENLKESLQEKQATGVVRKIFALPYDAMLVGPFGEFGQVLHKVYHNLDTIVPAFYGQILPYFLEVLIGYPFLCYYFGWIALSTPVLFISYTILAYTAGKRKAERQKELMQVLIKEFAKIMSVSTSYERAHYFGRVEEEVQETRKCFLNVGKNIRNVKGGEHKESLILMSTALGCTAVVMCLLSLTHVACWYPTRAMALGIYFFTFVGGLEQYAIAISNLRGGVVEYQVLQDFLDRISSISDFDGALEMAPCKPNEPPTIEFKNVSFGYNDKQVIDNLSFKLESGQRLGLCGESGCGKSTIIKLLLRLYRPSNGTILINNQNIDKVTGESLRRMFSVVTQDANLFAGTVRDNIGYGKNGATDDEIKAAAAMAGLDLVDSAPEKSSEDATKAAADGTTATKETGAEENETSATDISLDKEVGEKGARLSGGQQQRVSLARAILKNASVFLLDEPTTGLDGVIAKRLQETMDEISKSTTTICITHHLDDLKNADQIVHLSKNGTVLEHGTYKELLAQGGKFYEQVNARH